MHNFLAAAPLDLSAAGTEIAGYVAVAATSAVGIYVAVMGIRVILKVFGFVGKKG